MVFQQCVLVSVPYLLVRGGLSDLDLWDLFVLIHGVKFPGIFLLRAEEVCNSRVTRLGVDCIVTGFVCVSYMWGDCIDWGGVRGINCKRAAVVFPFGDHFLILSQLFFECSFQAFFLFIGLVLFGVHVDEILHGVWAGGVLGG